VTESPSCIRKPGESRCAERAEGPARWRRGGDPDTRCGGLATEDPRTLCVRRGGHRRDGSDRAPRGHEFVRDVVEAFAADVSLVTYGKPTLEDVFIHLTGHRFWSADAAGGAGA